MSDVSALLIDYEFCSGCSECELSCLAAHDNDPYCMGIKVVKLGPWKTRNGSWQYDFVPIPTDWCDLCQGRSAEGKKPACARGCKSDVISFGSVEEVSDYAKLKTKTLIFTPKQ